jgi:hypothetical protein
MLDYRYSGERNGLSHPNGQCRPRRQHFRGEPRSVNFPPNCKLIPFQISIALSKIGNYVYLIYVGWCSIETMIWYFLGVETRGRSLEEMDEIFNAPNPVKASKVKVVVKRDAETGSINIDKV